MIKYTKDSMFDSEANVFCQQLGCWSKMNTDLALEIRKKYPWVYGHYKNFIRNAAEFDKPEIAFGFTVFTFIDEERAVLTILSQVDYEHEDKNYIDREVLEDRLRDIAADDYFSESTLAFSYKLDYYNSKEDRDITHRLICDIFSNSKCNILICDYNEEIFDIGKEG